MKLFITEDADIDLTDIWQFIAKDNPAAATQILNSLDTRSRSLLVNPEIGLSRPDIREDFRHVVEGSYLILYRLIPEGVEIVRYLHGAMDLKSL